MSGYGSGGTSTTFGVGVAKREGGTETAEGLGALWIGMRHTMAKAFSWAYSKMKNYDVCPKRHYEVDLVKNFVDSGEAMIWGNEVHDAIAKVTPTGSPLPDSMKDYQRWVTEAHTGVFEGPEQWLRHLANPAGHTLIEQKLAITKDWQPCPWFAGNAWFRGVCDYARIDPTYTVALARDYKTGKPQHDSRQLMLMATCLFIHHPRLRRIKTQFVWLKDDCTTDEVFDKGTIMQEWVPVLGKVAQMQYAADTMTYPPQPGRLCARYCPVISCPFHGKRSTGL